MEIPQASFPSTLGPWGPALWPGLSPQSAARFSVSSDCPVFSQFLILTEPQRQIHLFPSACLRGKVFLFPTHLRLPFLSGITGLWGRKDIIHSQLLRTGRFCLLPRPECLLHLFHFPFCLLFLLFLFLSKHISWYYFSLISSNKDE